MKIINYINPFSSKYHALSDFKCLNSLQKFTVVFTAALISAVTLFLGVTPVFRALVNRFNKINLLNASSTIQKTYAVNNKTFNTSKDTKLSTNPTTPFSKKKEIPLTLTLIRNPKLLSPINPLNLSKLSPINNKTIKISNKISCTAIIPYESPLIVMNAGSYKLSHTDYFLDKITQNQYIKQHSLSIKPPSNYRSSLYLLPKIHEEEKELFDPSKLNRVIEPIANLENSIVLSESLIDFEYVPRSKTLIETRNELHYRGSYNFFGKFAELYALNLADDAIITINSIGEINQADQRVENQVGLFFELIQSTYGRKLGQVIINRYFRNNKGDEILSKVTYSDYKKVLTGAATNVKTETLKDLFHKIKRNNSNEIDYLCSDLLNEQKLEHLKSFKDFKDLSSEEINLLYRCYTNFCDKDGKYFSIFKDLLKGNYAQPSATFFDYYTHDAYLLDVLSQYHDLDPRDLPLSISEHLSKKIAYNELKVGMIIPILNSQMELCFYEVHDHLENKNDGVAAFLITPITHKNSFDHNKKDVFLTFRGTCPMPSQEGCAQSWKRDLEFSGIGKTSFLHRANDIKAMVESYLLDSDDNINLNITGHSLGACDAQRALLLMMKAINYNSYFDSPWKKIKKLTVKTYNAPRVEVKTITKFIEIHDSLEQKNLDLEIELTHIRYRDRDYDDLVQWYGEMLVGAKIHKSNLLKTKAIFITLDASFGRLGIVERHGSVVFSSPNKVDILNIENYEGNSNNDLQQILMQNHYWKESETALEEINNRICWHLSLTYTIPRDVFHLFLTAGFINPLLYAAKNIIGNRATNRQTLLLTS